MYNVIPFVSLSVYGAWVTLNKRDLGPFWVSHCIPSTCIVLFDYYVMSFWEHETETETVSNGADRSRSENIEECPESIARSLQAWYRRYITGRYKHVQARYNMSTLRTVIC